MSFPPPSGYMKQFRRHFSLDPDGRLMLMGRQVSAAINDRFVLNIMHQFNHQVGWIDLLGAWDPVGAGPGEL